MTFARLCEHGGYDAHAVLRGDCPGGSLLPPDSLIIVKEDGEWPEWAIDAFGRGPTFLTASQILDALAAAQPGTETVTTFTAFNVHVQEAP